MRRSTDILIVCTIVLIGIFTPVEVTYAQSAPAQAAGKKPNIVFILVDNLGYDELGSTAAAFCVALPHHGSTNSLAKAPVCSTST